MSRNLIGKKQNKSTQTGSVVCCSLGLFKMTLCPLDLASASPRLPERAWLLGCGLRGGPGAGLGGLPQARGEVPPRAPSLSPPLGRLGCSCCLGFPIHRDMGDACWERTGTHLVLLEQEGECIGRAEPGAKRVFGFVLVPPSPPLPPTPCPHPFRMRL